MAEENNIIKFKDWQKLDIRVGKIINAEDVGGADKLYKLEVDLGSEKTTLVAGIKEYYTKEQLKDKRIIVFTNLEPKKLRGIESKGMLLAAVRYDEDDNEVECKLLEPDDDIELGARVC